MNYRANINCIPPKLSTRSRDHGIILEEKIIVEISGFVSEDREIMMWLSMLCSLDEEAFVTLVEDTPYILMDGFKLYISLNSSSGRVLSSS